eukprot:712597-Rhodomonas_salina.1
MQRRRRQQHTVDSVSKRWNGVSFLSLTTVGPRCKMFWLGSGVPVASAVGAASDIAMGERFLCLREENRRRLRLGLKLHVWCLVRRFGSSALSSKSGCAKKKAVRVECRAAAAGRTVAIVEADSAMVRNGTRLIASAVRDSFRGLAGVQTDSTTTQLPFPTH